MSKKKPKIDKRLDKLFEDINADEAPAKPKAAPKPARPVIRQTTGLRPTAATKSAAGRKSIDPKGIVKAESVKSFVGEDGSPASLSMAFQLGKTDWATLQVVDETAPRPWSPDEQLLVKQVTDQLSLALENARLFQETQRALAETESLYRATAELNTATNFDQIRDVLRHHTIAGEAAAMALNLFDQPWNKTRQPESIEVTGVFGQLPVRKTGGLVDNRFTAEEFPLVEHLRPDQATIIEDFGAPQSDKSLKKLYATYLEKYHLGSGIYLPLVATGLWIGYINVNFTEPRNFAEPEVRRLTALASQAAVAVQNLRSLQTAQDRAREAEQRSRELAAVNELTQALTTQLSEATRVAQLAYWEYDVPADSYTFTDAFYALFHTTAAQENGYTMSAARYAQRFVHPEDADLVNAELQKALETGDPNFSQELDHRILYATGEAGYVTVRYRVEKDALGHTTKLLGATQDITERKKTEEAVRRQNQYLAVSSEISRLVTSTLDLQTLFTRTVNLVAERFSYYHAAIFIVEETGFNATLQEATGHAGEVMKEQRHSLLVSTGSIVGQVTQSGEAVIVNDTAASAIHKPNPLLPETKAEAAIPLRVGNRIIGALDIQSKHVNAFTEDDVAVLQTLADQVAIAIDNARSYELSVQAVKEMREIDRLKSQFLANMSHELRTPLNSIIGFSRVILKGIDGPVTELQQNDLTAIYNSGQHLLGLINDILDLSKIEAGKMELAFEEVNIGEVVNSVMSTATGLVKDKPIRLERAIPDDLPTANADAIRVRQVLLNLISNAAKFTDEGIVTVTAMIQDGAAGQPEIKINVTDTGPGISEEDQLKLFQAFSQVDDSPTRKTGGSGLGLSISQRLIHLHGGQIGVNSKPGEGSTFYFTLPIFHRPVVNTEGEGKTILAIDDDPYVIGLYERYLQAAGYRVVALTDPSQAVKTAAELHPFAITLDIMMPGFDGWQVLNSLKSDQTTRDIPVVICSIVEEQERGFSLGASDYLVKPILEEDLIQALDRLNGDGSIYEVLVIDDDPNDLNLMAKMLNEQGKYKPILAQGGQNGWDLIRSQPPQAVILDLFMPDMDGFKLLESMRASEKYREIPVIVVSGGDLTPDQQKQLRDFGQQLISKSTLSQQDLIETIARALRRVRAN